MNSSTESSKACLKRIWIWPKLNGIRISLSSWRGGVATTNGYKPTNGSGAVQTVADKTSAGTLDLTESDELVEVSNRRLGELLLIDTKILFVGRTGCLTNRIAEAKHALSYMDLQRAFRTVRRLFESRAFGNGTALL